MIVPCVLLVDCTLRLTSWLYPASYQVVVLCVLPVSCTLRHTGTCWLYPASYLLVVPCVLSAGYILRLASWINPASKPVGFTPRLTRWFYPASYHSVVPASYQLAVGYLSFPTSCQVTCVLRPSWRECFLSWHAVLRIRIRMDPHLKSPPGFRSAWRDADPDPDPGG